MQKHACRLFTACTYFALWYAEALPHTLIFCSMGSHSLLSEISRASIKRTTLKLFMSTPSSFSQLRLHRIGTAERPQSVVNQPIFIPDGDRKTFRTPVRGIPLTRHDIRHRKFRVSAVSIENFRVPTTTRTFRSSIEIPADGQRIQTTGSKVKRQALS